MNISSYSIESHSQLEKEFIAVFTCIQSFCLLRFNINWRWKVNVFCPFVSGNSNISFLNFLNLNVSVNNIYHKDNVSVYGRNVRFVKMFKVVITCFLPISWHYLYYLISSIIHCLLFSLRQWIKTTDVGIKYCRFYM